ncbi:hypothetical protein DFH09DRAFT_1210142 [Mycena vulgaris]|nr:hypothetical protein DFH09DRAFT_1210142 [Mycena vulgaris]
MHGGVFLLIVVHTLTNGLVPLSLRSCLTDPSLLSCIHLPLIRKIRRPQCTATALLDNAHHCDSSAKSVQGIRR